MRAMGMWPTIIVRLATISAVLGVAYHFDKGGFRRGAYSTDRSLQVDPPIVAFGSVRLGQTAVRRVVLINRRAKPRVIKSIALGAFFGVAELPSVPFTLAPGGTLEFSVSFAPSNTRQQSDKLEIETEDSLKKWSVLVQGRGAFGS